MDQGVGKKFKDLPKVELHVHLDTSLSYDLIRRVLPNTSFANYRTQFTVPDKCESLSHFLTFVEPSISLLQEETILRMAMFDLVQQQSSDSVIYSEIRLAPLLHTRNNLTPKQVAEIVCSAARDASHLFDLPVRLIFCTMRHFTESQGIETALLAAAYQDQGVVGFDLAGAEADFPLKPHLEAFRIAADAGLGITAHAGEAKGPESILETLEAIPVTRIGHGVRVLDCKNTLQMLLDRQVHLEVCPISNIKIDVFRKMEDHAVDALMREGVFLGINTDGWGLFQTSLSEEYEALEVAFGWTHDHFLKINQMAVGASFTDELTKEQLYQKLNEGYTPI